MPNHNYKHTAHGLFFTALGAFYLSGACGLIYQVTWTRKLVLLFGTTAYAISAVLFVFFLGLGLGSLWGGRLADRTPRLLRLYGWLELGIGVWAILFLALIGWGESLVVTLLRAIEFSRGAGITLRALLATALLLAPVTFMGATLPVLARFVTRAPQLRGRRIGALYAANTFGAVTGCAAAGFLLIPALGYTKTTLIGAGLNSAIGLVSITLSRIFDAPPSKEAPPLTAPVEVTSEIPPARRWILLGFMVSGFCALALESLWTRMLIMVFHGTTYAFTTMLTTVLAGIALGSIAASAFVDRRKHLVTGFGLVLILIGLTTVGTLSAIADIPGTFLEKRADLGYDWAKLTWLKFRLSFTALFLPTFFSGMTFPFAVRAYTGGAPRLGRDTGKLYFTNTLGGVLGALAGGFLILPALGAQAGVMVLAAALCLAGLALVLACPTSSRMIKGSLAAASAATALLAYARAPEDITHALNAAYMPKDSKTLFYKEGVEGTVAVSEEPNAREGSDRVLWINGVQATATYEHGVKMNRLQGVMPFLFDRDPKRALFMCFGSGITAGTLGLADLERIDAVEISPEVLEAAPLFAQHNKGVLDNPRVVFHVDDGRNFLLTATDHYDIITFEPMPLANTGVSTFYTREYYELCHKHLTPRGLVSQWIPLHSLSPDIVRSLAYTFTTVFPEYCLWFINADLFIIGSDEPLLLDYTRATALLERPQLREALADTGLDDINELLTHFFMDKESVDRYVAGGRVMTDDWPWAEFIAPKLVHEQNVEPALIELRPYYQSPASIMVFPGVKESLRQAALAGLDRRYRSRQAAFEGLIMLRGLGVLGEPEKPFEEALAIDPGNKEAQFYLALIAVRRAELIRDQPHEAEAILTHAAKLAPDDWELRMRLGDLYFERGELEKAFEHYEAHARIAPPAAHVRERLRARNTPPR